MAVRAESWTPGWNSGRSHADGPQPSDEHLARHVSTSKPPLATFVSLSRLGSLHMLPGGSMFPHESGAYPHVGM
ncbi:hypothetical protein ACRE_060470 [Hapsidospora chrysogenum ATCC 11550]|uniref:Uncharacterized protein n=1 Tax=Hapsidospora chrysogenum (strain ATCC 11550 / CBS 779.69 / DSM 880 / IAM 14645 / JCM 23072 / IMI 49137) TaxID=857340 RepID=A0A086T1F4_HAPC1|nr:hypothetical protein ACRE_060470 [Hapsidospora chrysogenum ATCC 11550]